jgi:uncharacterized protein YdbL (DUF1318 family)
MDRKASRYGLSGLFAATLSACITVNIYFPAPEVRKAAEQIVEETWGEQSGVQPATPGTAPADTSWIDVLGPASAYAQDVDINVSTAAIRALKEAMKTRAEQLKPYLNQGQLGIGKDGMLVVRSLEGVALREQATARRLIEAENADRKTLYKEIAQANKFGDERVDDIQRIFADTWIDKAEKGWWVQKQDGSWVKK